MNTWKDQVNALANEINTTVATIPSGTINDGVIGADKVYSNQKTEAEYKIITGVDANSNWTKFPDGTCIIYGATATLTMTNTQSFDLQIPLPFVVTNYDKTAVAVSSKEETTDVLISRGWIDSGQNIYLQAYTRLIADVTQTFKLGYIVTGHWK